MDKSFAGPNFDRAIVNARLSARDSLTAEEKSVFYDLAATEKSLSELEVGNLIWLAQKLRSNKWIGMEDWVKRAIDNGFTSKEFVSAAKLVERLKAALDPKPKLEIIEDEFSENEIVSQPSPSRIPGETLSKVRLPTNVRFTIDNKDRLFLEWIVSFYHEVASFDGVLTTFTEQFETEWNFSWKNNILIFKSGHLHFEVSVKNGVPTLQDNYKETSFYQSIQFD